MFIVPRAFENMVFIMAVSGAEGKVERKVVHSRLYPRFQA